jgi:MSHA biogenesis protein MshL
MKKIILNMLLFVVFSASVAQATVNVEINNESINIIIPTLCGQFDTDPGIDLSVHTSLKAKNLSEDEALTQVLTRQGLTFVVQPDGRYRIVRQPSIDVNISHQPLTVALSIFFSGLPFSPVLKDGADPRIPVSMYSKSMPMDAALTSMVSQAGYSWRREGNTIAIFRDVEAHFQLSSPALEQDITVNSSLSSNGASSGGTSSVASGGIAPNGGTGTGVTGTGMASTSLSTSTASAKVRGIGSAADGIKALLSPEGKFFVFPESGLVIVRDRYNIVKMIGELIDDLNKFSTRMVHIDGVITEVTLNNDFQAGVDWTTVINQVAGRGTALNSSLATTALFQTTSVFNAAFTFNKNSQAVYVQALQHYGDVKVVSKPNISVANGSVGSLTVGQTIFIVSSAYTSTTSTATSTTSLQTTPLQTGLNFSVIPHVINDREAIIYLSPDLTSDLQISQISAGGMTVQTPSFSQKQTQTVVTVKNGEKILLSGMMQDSDSKTNDGVPFLSSIPVIGNLFKATQTQKQKTEFALMVEVTW